MGRGSYQSKEDDLLVNQIGQRVCLSNWITTLDGSYSETNKLLVHQCQWVFWITYRVIIKKILPTFGPRTIIPFAETEWNFGIRHCEVCAQEWYGKQQCHSVTVRKFWNFQVATPSFLYWNMIFIMKSPK